jgi:hypothetical protein
MENPDSAMPPLPASLSPAPEVHAVQADWSAEPNNSPERREAMRALAVLAEAGDAELEDAEDVPPLPDSLRARWEEAYGDAGKTQAAAPGRSFLATLRSWFAMDSHALAWGGGVAMAALAVMLFVRMEPAGEGLSPGAVTRGTPTATLPGKAAPVYVIASGPEVDAVILELRAAFPSRTIAAVATRELVPAGPAVVLESSAAYQKNPETAVSAVEAMDEAAATPAP